MSQERLTSCQECPVSEFGVIRGDLCRVLLKAVVLLILQILVATTRVCRPQESTYDLRKSKTFRPSSLS